MIFQNTTSGTTNTWTRAFAFLNSGTVSIANDSDIVTGAGTSFTTEISQGDTIIINNIKRIVISINSNTQLVVNEAYNSTLSGQNIVNMPARYRLTGQNKVILFAASSLNTSDIILAESANGAGNDISTTVASMFVRAGQTFSPLVFVDLSNVFVQSVGLNQRFFAKINQ